MFESLIYCIFVFERFFHCFSLCFVFISLSRLYFVVRHFIFISSVGLTCKSHTETIGAAKNMVTKRYDNIIKSAEDKRLYRGLELSNRMKVLLVSDPTTDKSAAAMDVNVGKVSALFLILITGFK